VGDGDDCTGCSYEMEQITCALFVSEVDDKNNEVSPCCMAHRIRAKIKIVGFVSRIRFCIEYELFMQSEPLRWNYLVIWAITKY